MSETFGRDGCFKALIGDEDGGFINSMPQNWQEGIHLYIEDTTVLPAHRGKGIEIALRTREGRTGKKVDSITGSVNQRGSTREARQRHWRSTARGDEYLLFEKEL